MRPDPGVLRGNTWVIVDPGFTLFGRPYPPPPNPSPNSNPASPGAGSTSSSWTEPGRVRPGGRRADGSGLGPKRAADANVVKTAGAQAAGTVLAASKSLEVCRNPYATGPYVCLPYVDCKPHLLR